MNESKNIILEKIRRNKPGISPLPEPEAFALPEGSLVDLFEEKLINVGGRCLKNKPYSELSAEIKKNFPDAENKWSGESRIAESTINFGVETDPHHWEVLDLAVVKGEFGVAENGAIWVEEQNLPQRVTAFICQHLVIVLGKDQIVGNMHQAYRRLTAPFVGYGVFISGPSKTADIEQSLVIGAQGPKSLTVYLI